MMHCFGHINEGNGVEVIDWKKPATSNSPPRKCKALHSQFQEDRTEIHTLSHPYRKIITEIAHLLSMLLS